MRDIACAGYVAGGNTQFFAGTTKDLKNHLENNLSGDSANGLVASVNKNMSDRLSFSDDVTSKYASMLAFPMSASQYEEGGIENVMSVTTRLLPWEVQANGAGVNNSFPGGNGAFTQYSQQFNLGSIHYGEDMKAAENMEFISQVGLRPLKPKMHPHAETLVDCTSLDLTTTLLCIRRARPTMPFAFSGRLASTAACRGRRRSSSLARAILDPMRFLG